MKINLIKHNGNLIPHDTEAREKVDEFQDGAIYEVDIKNMDKRSLQQNKSLHKWCSMISSKLNSENMAIQHVIKLNSKWSGDRVKELIFKPTIEHLYNKKSTTKLNKNEFDLIIDTVTKYLGEKGIVCPEFPEKKD